MSKRPFMSGYKTSTSPRGSASAWRKNLADRMGIAEARERVGRQTPEDILGVPVGAPWSVVRSAYRRLALEYHPDRAAQNGMSEADATELFKQLLAAYTVLEGRR